MLVRNFLNRLAAVALFSGMVCSIGCWDGENGEGGSTQPLLLDNFAAEYAAARCSLKELCIGEAQMTDMGFPIGDECITAVGKEYRNQQLSNISALILAGVVVYDADRARRCVNILQTSTCEGADHASQVCREVFQGTVPVGERCLRDEACADPANNYCQMAGECPGTCTPRIAEGRDCSGLYDQCSLRTVCWEERCVVPPGFGEECGGGTEPACRGKLFCVGETEEQTGQCESFEELFVRGEGATCDLSRRSYCRDGLYCSITSGHPDDTEGVCLSRGADAGETCHPSFPDACPVNYFCDIDPEAQFQVGKCTSLSIYGQPCAGEEERCAFPGVCVNGLCLLPVDNGQPCSSDEACYSGNCAGGRCMSPEPCGEYED